MPEQDSAFLLKQRLKIALDEVSHSYKPWQLHKDEIQTLDEVKALLRAGSEILMRRLREREAEATEMFKQGISALSTLKEQIRMRIQAEEKERERERQMREQAEEEERERLSREWVEVHRSRLKKIFCIHIPIIILMIIIGIITLPIIVISFPLITLAFIGIGVSVIYYFD